MNVALTRAEKLHLREFWEFCEPHFLEITLATRRETSHLSARVKAPPPGDETAPNAGDAALRDLVRGAIHREEWQPLLDSLRLDGSDHAAGGLDLAAWYEFTRGFRRIAIRMLESDPRSDRHARARILEGLTLYQSITMRAIAETYLRA